MPGPQLKQNRDLPQQRLTIVIIITGIVLILVAVIMIPYIGQSFSSQGEIIQPPLVSRPSPHGSAIGDPNAPLVIEEYTDFSCSHCRTFAFSRAEEITAKYVATGKVYFVFNSVGNMLGHPNSVYAAEAAYCAGDQGQFWQYHDLLFANQTALFSNINRKIDRPLTAIAEALGLDLEQFQACLEQDGALPQIQEDQVEAFQANIFETPSFTLNGVLFEGDWTKGELETAIEAALADITP